MGKPIMYCDVEFLPAGLGIKFYYMLEHGTPQSITNPSAEWLFDFALKDQPYELFTARGDWAYAWRYTIAKEAEPSLNTFLNGKGYMTEEDANRIISRIIKRYDPKGSTILASPYEYMVYVDLKNAEFGWVKCSEKGE